MLVFFLLDFDAQFRICYDLICPDPTQCRICLSLFNKITHFAFAMAYKLSFARFLMVHSFLVLKWYDFVQFDVKDLICSGHYSFNRIFSIAGCILLYLESKNVKLCEYKNNQALVPIFLGLSMDPQ